MLRIAELEEFRGNGNRTIDALQTAYELKFQQYGRMHADIDPICNKLSSHIHRRVVPSFDSGQAQAGLDEFGRLNEMAASYGKQLPAESSRGVAWRIIHIAVTHFETGRSDEAIAWLETAIDTLTRANAPQSDISEVRAKLSEYLESRAAYYESVGDHARAEKDRQRIAALNDIPQTAYNYSSPQLRAPTRAQVRTVPRQVVKTPASTIERVIPAVTKMETRRVIKTPAATQERVVPAVTRQVSRRVVKTPAGENNPATYETVTETVVVTPQSVDYVEIPATYETVSETVVVQEASTDIITVPATYEIVSDTVVVQEASTDLVTNPAVIDDGSRKFTDVLTFYGTNRVPIRESFSGKLTYSGENSKRVEYGWTHITVPKVRKPGSVKIADSDEEPKEELHFILKRTTPFSGSTAFGERLRDSLDCTYYDFSNPGDPVCLQRAFDKPKELLIFIHGHNVSFKNAAMRTAQLSVDLDISSGVFYSWPAGAHAAAYGTSRTNADESDDHLLEFLQTVIEKADNSSIHLVAHSMGNRVLMNALQKLQNSPQGDTELFDQIIFASPDVDELKFAGIAEEIEPLSKGMTVYASSKDKALQISSFYPKNKRRAGLAPPAPEIIEASVNLKYIDTSKLDRSGWAGKFIAHADFTAGAFKDVRYLFWKEPDPDERCVLSREPDPKSTFFNQNPKPALKYWITVPKKPEDSDCEMKTFGDAETRKPYLRYPPVLTRFRRPAQTIER
jgi:esterase/lipase superfamily enzyme